MDETWREIYQSVDEEEALARVLELSRIEYERNQAESRMHRDTPNRGTQPSSEAPLLLGTADTRAIPLCLPNNCQWNAESSEYITTGERRSSLHVVEEALEKLRKVKGPVCVVSIAGPYRKGKSYILSEAFDQPEVFPLGHEMVAETMGIWLWIVPGKYKDSRGQEFTVVLLDSEGIDATTSAGYDDNQIFTLTVLLASVLIYNSQGVPTRRDLEGLDFIVKLSQRIQIQSNEGVTANRRKETDLFHRTFPFFLWLLRDVTQSIPRDCKDLKEYFLKKVFRDQDSSLHSCHKSQEAAESILRFFSGFDAFHLPPPTADGEIMRSLHENKSQLLSQFLTRLENFKSLLRSVLVPKHSCIDGQFVTGEGLAALVTLYVEAINTPGVIPNVQSAWHTFVETKCFDARRMSQKTYDDRMTALLSDKMPCDNDEIRESHNIALKECQRQFMAETTGIATNTTEKHLRALQESLSEKLKTWQTENDQLTGKFCHKLLLKLKQKHQDPVLHQLQGSNGSKLSFDDILGVYYRVKVDYDEQAVGAKDVIAATLFNFHEELTRETRQYLELLRQMKNFDGKAAKEIKIKAYQERERRRLEEQQLRLQQENQENKMGMNMLISRLAEERAALRQQMQSEMDKQRIQMENMMAASMREARKEREAFIREKEALEERFLAIQKSNEENMRMIQNMSELIAKQEKEKKELRENAKELPQEEFEDRLAEMSGKHNEEAREFLEKAESQQAAIDMNEMKEPNSKDEKELPQMINERTKRAAALQQRIEDTHQEQAEVEKPSYWRKGFKFVARVAPVVGKVVAAVQPQTAAYAEPVAVALGAAADFASEECSIM